jgi:hypothetical protein
MFMNKFACSALALAAAGSVGFADPADDGEWLGLDQDLVDLHATTSLQGGGPSIGALLRSYYVSPDDDISPDTAGWLFQDVDLWLEGEVGDFDWRVSLDYGDDYFFGSSPSGSFFSDSVLEDAFATWNIGDDFDVTWGQFKFGHTLSSDVDPEDQVLISRTLIGGYFDDWMHGVMVGGDFEEFTWRAAIQNGDDGLGDEYKLSARGEYHMNGGSGGKKAMEGAMGAGDDIMATIGVFFADDGVYDDGQSFGIDFHANMDVFSVGGEYADFDTDIGDASPWAITGSMLFGDDEFEAALRFEDADDSDDTTAFTAGVNWYLTGRNAYWSLNFTDISSDDSFSEGSLFALGLSVGATRAN